MNASLSPMQTSGPRNVIWITTDHMRYDCVGAHGNAEIHTPNLDRLVAGGVSFSQCFCNSPTCMPSRSSFMTGCYPAQTGVVENGQALPEDFNPTVARAFSHGGFRTVQIGKLHLQPHEDSDLDPRSPADFGFDVFKLSEEPGCYEDAYRTWLRSEHPELVETFTVPRPNSPGRKWDTQRFQVLDAPWQCSHSGWIAEQATRYLTGWGPRPEPQFLHLGFYAPHPPLNPTREMFEPYRDRQLAPVCRNAEDWNDPDNHSDAHLLEYRRHFYAMITGVDLAIGRLLDELEAMGTLNETLIVFSADHGDTCGDHGRMGKGPTFYDSIMRVPLILHWPEGLGRKQRQEDGFVELVDVLPTLLALSGVSIPKAMQGRCLAPALLKDQVIDGREDVFAIHGQGSIMLRNASYKYLRYEEESGPREVLYDLSSDPQEFYNIAAEEEHVGTLSALRNRAFTRTLHASRSLRERIAWF